MSKINLLRRSLINRCILLAILSTGTAQADDSSLTVTSGVSSLSNATFGQIKVFNSGTELTLTDVTSTNSILVLNGGQLTLNDVIIGSSTYCSSCSALVSQGFASSSSSAIPTTISGSNVTISNSNTGIYSTFYSTIDLQNLTIDNVKIGLDLNGSSTADNLVNLTTISNFSITNFTKYGVEALYGAEVHLTDGTISTDNDYATGVYLAGGNSSYTNSTTGYFDGVNIITNGSASVGFLSAQLDSMGAISYWSNSTITTNGDNSSAVSASYSGNTINISDSSQVTANGDNSTAIFSIGNAEVIVNGSQVTTTGSSSPALYSYYLGNITLENGSTVNTSGSDSDGAKLVYGGTVTLQDSSITTTGTDADAIYVLAGTTYFNSVLTASTVTIDGSTLQSAQGYGINVEGGAVDISVSGNSVITGGSGLMNVEDTPSTTSTSFDQGVTTVNLSVDSSSVYGVINTASTAVSNITLTNNSLWEIDGDSNVSSLYNDNSTIQFVSASGSYTSADDFSTLTISSDYTGIGGTIIFNIIAGDDDSLSDKLVIDGDVSGQTYVQVINRNGLGALTTEGILLIDVTGTSASDAFQLQSDYTASNGNAAIVAGAYSYSLYQGSTSDPDDGNWYLRSIYDESLVTTGNTTEDNLLYQPGVPLYENYANVLHQLNWLDSKRARIGERQYYYSSQPTSLEQPFYGVWGRVQGSHSKLDPSKSTGHSQMDTDIWKVQIGNDILAKKNDSGQFVFGVNAFYGQASADVSSKYGNGKIETNSYGFGTTLTWYGNNNTYVDAQTQLNWFDSNIDSYTLARSEVSNNKGLGFAAGLEAGHSFKLNNRWAVTPQAQIIYSNVRYDSFEDAYQTSVSLDKKGQLTGRLGISADYHALTSANNILDIYADVNLYQKFMAKERVDVAGVKIERKDDTTWAGIGVGTTYNLGKNNYAIYAKVNVLSSVDNFADSYGVSGMIGLQYNF